MKRFMKELWFKQQRYVVYCDNQSAIHLSKNSTFHARSKHIDVRYHWMRDALNENLFEIEKIHTDHNVEYVNEVTTKGEAWSLLFNHLDGKSLHIIGNWEICWAFPHVEGLT